MAVTYFKLTNSTDSSDTYTLQHPTLTLGSVQVRAGQVGVEVQRYGKSPRVEVIGNTTNTEVYQGTYSPRVFDPEGENLTIGIDELSTLLKWANATTLVYKDTLTTVLYSIQDFYANPRKPQAGTRSLIYDFGFTLKRVS